MHIRILGISNKPVKDQEPTLNISDSDMGRHSLDYYEDMAFDWDECKEVIEDMFPDETGLIFNDKEHSFSLSENNNADGILKYIQSCVANVTAEKFFRDRESIIIDLQYCGSHDLFWLDDIEYPMSIYGELHNIVDSKFYVYAIADAHI